jgi:2,5-diketo-D-gluconate reductase A
MSKENQFTMMKRRQFLQTSAKAAAAAMFFSVSSSRVFGSVASAGAEISIPSVSLNNGIKMPILGFGTFMLRGEVCANSVAEAISQGYRLIDTATVYGNEEAVGAGIKKSGIKREELFITSKVWIHDPGYEHAKKEFQISLDKLGTEYLDLYLIHRPRGDVKSTWKAMEELYKEGKIKAIGISNFEPAQLDELKTYSTITPAVNQIESHAFFQQNEALEDLTKRGIVMEAWAPFAEGRNGLFTNETLAAIGKKYGKSNAQVSLRCLFQKGIVSIPRSQNKDHMAENLNIFDFKLTESDMKTITALDLNKTQFPEW